MVETELDPVWAADLLRRRVPGLERLVRLDAAPAVPLGDNYASELVRARAEVELQDGSPSSVRFIVKDRPRGDHVNQLFSNALRPFHLEIKMYSQVLPVLEKLLEKTEEEAKMWPSCWDFTPYSRIVLEDLTMCDYRTPDRMKGFSLDEAEFVLRALGRFHAASMVAAAEGTLDGDQFGRYFVTRGLRVLDEFYGGMIRLLSEEVRAGWGPEWTDLADRLAHVSETFSTRLQELRDADPAELLVLNHGDFWPMNVMLKYDADGRPFSIRMVDFQISHHASLGWDLTTFFFTSAAPALRLSHHCRLLAEYHTALAATLARLAPDLPRPSLDDVTRETDRLLFLGLFYVAGDLAYIVAPKDNVITMDEMFRQDQLVTESKMKIYQQPYYTTILKQYLQFFQEKNII